jgi:solute carrier family 25 citrate transporter 1
MIVRRETPLALYKGLGAVLSGIVPKMGIRFASFETYKGWLADPETGKTAVGNIFLGAFFVRRAAGVMTPILVSFRRSPPQPVLVQAPRRQYWW